MRLRAEFGFGCEIRGDNYYAILLKENAPEIRVIVAEDRLTALAALAPLPEEETARTRLMQHLNAKIDVSTMAFSVVNDNVTLLVSLPLPPSPPSPPDDQLHPIANVFTGAVRMLADKVQDCHAAVVANIGEELGRL